MIHRHEMAVLGKAMENQDVLEMVMAECTEHHFTFKDSKALFEVIGRYYQDGRMPKAGELMQKYPNGAEFIQECFTEGLKTLEVENDMRQVRKNYQRMQYRKMVDMLSELTFAEGFEPDDAASIIDNFTPRRYEVTGEQHRVDPKVAAKEALNELKEAMKTPGQVKGLSLCYMHNGAKVGFKGLDYALNGLRKGDLIMFAAKSGHGKTALAMNIARILSYHNGKRVYYLNTEMDTKQMVNRWAAMATKLEYGKIERGEITQSELELYEQWAERFGQSPITLSRIPSLSPEAVKGLAKLEMKISGHVDCLIVDYVGRMNLDQTKGMQEYQIMSTIVKQLKEIAMELDIPILTLAQLNDEGKLEGAKKMRNECDGLFFFYPKQTKIQNEEGETVHMESQTEYLLIKEKVRRGSTEGAIHCEFEKSIQFIREVS